MNVGILWEVLLNYRATAKRIPTTNGSPSLRRKNRFLPQEEPFSAGILCSARINLGEEESPM